MAWKATAIFFASAELALSLLSRRHYSDERFCPRRNCLSSRKGALKRGKVAKNCKNKKICKATENTERTEMINTSCWDLILCALCVLCGNYLSSLHALRLLARMVFHSPFNMAKTKYSNNLMLFSAAPCLCVILFGGLSLKMAAKLCERIEP